MELLPRFPQHPRQPPPARSDLRAHGLSGSIVGIQRQLGLHPYVQRRHVQALKHDFGSLLPGLWAVLGRLGQDDRLVGGVDMQPPASVRGGVGWVSVSLQQRSQVGCRQEMWNGGSCPAWRSIPP